jgi:hypothetical protein
MGALSDLWNSERGLLAVLLIIGVTVLGCLGRITFEEWSGFSKWIFGAYAISKTATGVVAAIKGTPEQAQAPAPATPPAPAASGDGK